MQTIMDNLQRDMALAEFYGLARILAEVHIQDGDCLGKIAGRLFELTDTEDIGECIDLIRKEYDC